MPASAILDVDLNQARLIKQYEQILKQLEGRGVNLRFNTGGLGPQGLGTISKDAREFEKSLAAAESRVLAFGAVASQIYLFSRAFTELVKSTVNVEKSLTDINVILDVSQASLSKFRDSLFDIARKTGQTFDTVAKSATEFARQGLSVEETLKRTKDALILTRLSGLDVVASTEAITAALNSFNDVLLDSNTLINKFAKVDAAFAVSAGDLAEALQRVGSSAQDSKVSLDSLIALVTSAQQTTARGGSVIGNSLKTIFQRLQRPEVLQQLQDLGVRVTDLGGNVLAADKVLINLAQTYGKLSPSQKNFTTQLAAGVFQANVFKALINDLAKGDLATYEKALRSSSSAIDEAIVRNEALNKTLKALLNESLASLQSVFAKIGNQTVGPLFKFSLDSFNDLFNPKDLNTKSAQLGKNFGEGLIRGLVDFATGPGFILFGVALGKLLLKTTTFIFTAFKSLTALTAVIQDQGRSLNNLAGIQNGNNQASNTRLITETNILQVLKGQYEILSRATPIIQQSKSFNKLDKNNFIASPLQGKYSPNLKDSIFAGGSLSDAPSQAFSRYINIPIYNPKTSQYHNPGPGGKGFGSVSGLSQDELRLVGAVGPGFTAAQGPALDPLRQVSQLQQSENNLRDKRATQESFRQAQRIDFFTQAITRQKEQAEPSALLQAQKNIDRQGRIQNRLFGAAFALPFIQGQLEQNYAGDDSLSGRRKNAAIGLVGGIGGSAVAGGFVGSQIGPAGTLPGAIIGGTIGLITGVSNAMKIWNDTLPDLIKNLDELKDVSLKINSTGDELVRLSTALNDPNTSPKDFGKIRAKISDIINRSPVDYKGIDYSKTDEFANRRDLLEKRNQTQKDTQEFEIFIQKLKDIGELKPQREIKGLTPGPFGPDFVYENSPGVLSPGARKNLELQFLSKTNNKGQNILSALTGDDYESRANRGILQSNNKSLIIEQLPQIFKSIGIAGRGVTDKLGELDENEFKTLFTPLITGIFSNKNLDRIATQQNNDTEKAQKEQDITALFNKELKELISHIQDFSITTEELNKRILNSVQTQNKINDIIATSNLKLSEGYTDVFTTARLSSRNQENTLFGDTNVKRRANANEFTNAVSKAGLDRLLNIRTNNFADASLEVVRNFQKFGQDIEKFVGETQKTGTINPETAQELLNRGLELNKDQVIAKDKSFKDNLEALNIALKTAKEKDLTIIAEQNNGLELITANLLESIKTLQKFNTFSGALSNFKTGEFSRDELVSQELSVNKKRNRESGRSRNDALSEAGQLFKSELSYNSTTFYDDLANGAVDTARTIKTEFAGAFKAFASGTKDAEDAFRDFALSIATNVQSKIIDLGVNSLLGSLFGNSTSGLTGAVAGGLASSFTRKSTGGLVTGGSGTKDDIPALLSGGEFVIKKSVVDKLGTDTLDSINNTSNISLTNRYDYNDPSRPSAGNRVISPFLSSFALEDDNNPQNRIRNQREDALRSYIADFQSYNNGKDEALKAFRKQKQSQLIGTYISSAISAVGAYAQAGGFKSGPTGITSAGYSNAGIGTTQAVNQSGMGSFFSAVRGHAQGGPIFGGNSPSDNIPAMLTGGEYVMNRASTNRIGLSRLNALNSGLGYASGGLVGGNNSSVEDTNDLLSRLIDSNEKLNNTLSSANSPTNPSSVNQGGNNAQLPNFTISNNITIEKSGGTTTDTKENKDSDDNSKAKQLNEALNAAIYSILIKESRIGGLLYNLQKAA